MQRPPFRGTAVRNTLFLSEKIGQRGMCLAGVQHLPLGIAELGINMKDIAIKYEEFRHLGCYVVWLL
jgi:hypothetical protein